jgi:hypothetical protein
MKWNPPMRLWAVVGLSGRIMWHNVETPAVFLSRDAALRWKRNNNYESAKVIRYLCFD